MGIHYNAELLLAAMIFDGVLKFYAGNFASYLGSRLEG